MARVTFFRAFDIRDLPGEAITTRAGTLALDGGATRLSLGVEAAAYRAKLAQATPFDEGSLQSGGTLIARLGEIRDSVLDMAGLSGEDFARALFRGNDLVAGCDADERLFGFRGDDTIIGGRGADLLSGGAGADVFRFMALSDSIANGADRITDFQTGRDLIDLARIDAVHGVAGNQAFDFVAEAGFSRVAGELRWQHGRLEGDVDGDGVADFMLRFDGGHAPGLDDLML